MPDLYQRAAVARATGMPPQRIERFKERNLIPEDEGDTPANPGSGNPRVFGLRTCRRIGLLHVLLSAGLPPRAAAAAASAVMDRGQFGRERGCCFDSGGTLLICGKAESRVVNARPDTLLATVLNDGTGRPANGALVIDVEATFSAITAALRNA